MRKRWKVQLQFKGGINRFTSFSLSDLAAFIKKYDKKKLRKTLPINPWLIDMVFDKATSIYPIEELVSATIFQED